MQRGWIRWAILGLVISLCHKASGQMPKVLLCRGNLKAFVVKDKASQVVNDNSQGLVSRSFDWDKLLIGVDLLKPFIEVVPWMGIQSTQFPENFKKEFHVDFISDSETYFYVRVTGRRSGLANELICELRVDERGPASKPSKGPTPKPRVPIKNKNASSRKS